MALMIYIIQTLHIEKIEHKFLESSLTMMKVDSKHSATKNTKRHAPVFTVEDWLTIFNTARSNRNTNKDRRPHSVEKLIYNDFFYLYELLFTMIKIKLPMLITKNLIGLKLEYTKSKPISSML